jgi:hypothetical protein
VVFIFTFNATFPVPDFRLRPGCSSFRFHFILFRLGSSGFACLILFSCFVVIL